MKMHIEEVLTRKRFGFVLNLENFLASLSEAQVINIEKSFM